jgi:hypothetical protein
VVSAEPQSLNNINHRRLTRSAQTPAMGENTMEGTVAASKLKANWVTDSFSKKIQIPRENPVRDEPRVEIVWPNQMIIKARNRDFDEEGSFTLFLPLPGRGCLQPLAQGFESG